MSATQQKLSQGKQSRDRLLNAAAELLATGGYSGTRVEAIAERAGVVKSALYWHFGSKNGLLLATLERTTALWVEEVLAAVRESADPMQRLDRLLAYIRNVIVNRPAARKVVFTLLLERSHDDEVCRQSVAALFGKLRTSLGNGFVEAIPIPEERAHDIADAIVSFADGLFLHYLADPNDERLDRSLASLRRMVVSQVTWELQRTSRR